MDELRPAQESRQGDDALSGVVAQRSPGRPADFVEALRLFAEDLRCLGYGPPEFMAFDSETETRIRHDVPAWAQTSLYSDPRYTFRKMRRLVRLVLRIEGVTIGTISRAIG